MAAKVAKSQAVVPPIQHYRKEQYIVAPFEILTDPSLTDGDRRMLLALCSFAIGKSLLWPSRQAIAERAGICITNVSKRVSRLVGFGWVTVQRRGDRSNKYFLHLPPRLTATSAVPPVERDESDTEPEHLRVSPPTDEYEDEYVDVREEGHAETAD